MKILSNHLKYLILLIFVICLTSCGKEFITIDNPQEVLNPDKICKYVSKPAGIHVFDDELFVINAEDNYVYKFDRSLEFLEKIYLEGLDKAQDIFVNEKYFYILDKGTNKVKIFNKDFGLDKEFILKEVPYYYYRYMDVLDGVVYLTNTAISKDYTRISYVDLDGKQYWMQDNFFGALYTKGSQIYAVETLMFYTSGNKQIVESGKNAIYNLNKDQIKKVFSLPSRFQPLNMCMDEENIFLLEGRKDRVSRFDLKGNYIDSIMSDIKYDNHKELGYNFCEVLGDYLVISSYHEDNPITIINLKGLR